MAAAAFPRQSSGGFSKIFWLVVLAAAILCAHAVVRHGDVAQDIRRCVDNGGVFQIWEERGGCVHHNLVKLPDGRVGDQITVIGEDGKIYEVTDYVPKKGVLSKIEDWLTFTKRAARIFRK